MSGRGEAFVDIQSVPAFFPWSKMRPINKNITIVDVKVKVKKDTEQNLLFLNLFLTQSLMIH